MHEICLFEDTFSSFPLGPFPYDSDHSAMGEYHYYPEIGYKGQWYDPIANYNYKGPSWVVTSPLMDGHHMLEQMRIEQMRVKWSVPILAGGNTDWTDYTLEVCLRPLSKDLMSGVLFRYQTSLMHYGLFFTEDGLELHRVEKLERTVLVQKKLAWSSDDFQMLKVVVIGSSIVVFHDKMEVLRCEDSRYANGGIALCACMPTQYASVSVKSDAETIAFLQQKKMEKENRVLEKQKMHAQPKLHKKIDLKNFGAGRQIRFGHLTGTDELFFVMCQHQRRVFKDRYPFISCMTAVSVETGEVLWQIGESRDDADVLLLTTDLPFQIYDIDDDGIDEVIASWDFKLVILDGKTGKVKKEMPTPENVEEVDGLCGVEFGHHAFSRLNVDAIRIVNVSGKKRPSDLLIKDRYARIWIYDDQLQLIWKFSHNNTGHFPYAHDYNGDGKDEIFSCYNMIDSSGKLQWELPISIDHTDEIVVGPIDPDQDDLLAIVSGWEGFMLLDTQGNVLKRDINGHGQRISVGNYCPKRKGLEICTTTYWGSQGIVYMHTCKGEEIWHQEMRCNGNVIAPVNWDGSGQDLILLNPNAQNGGLMDGEGDIVVSFPDDGHPELCAEVLNLTGDERDELVLWDRKQMWIYTQDREQEKREKVYLPFKYPLYNASNYRGEYCFPNWVER